MQRYDLFTESFSMVGTAELDALREAVEVAGAHAEQQADYADVWFHKWLDESVAHGDTLQELNETKHELSVLKEAQDDDSLVAAYRFALSARDERIDTLEGDYGRQTAALRDAESLIAQLHERIADSETLLERQSSSIVELEDEVDDLYESVAAREADIAALNDEIAEMNDEITDLNDEVGDLNDEVTDLTEDMADLSEQLDAARATSDEGTVEAVEFWFDRWLEAARRNPVTPRYSVADGSIYDAMTGRRAHFGSDSIAQTACDNIAAGCYGAEMFLWSNV